MRKKKWEIYLAIDVEADGPIPGDYSMLSFGCYAFIFENGQKIEIGRFTRNLKLLPRRKGHPEQMEWWKKFPEAWEACRRDPISPLKAMREFRQWLKDIKVGREEWVYQFVSKPAAYDHSWMYWYYVHFLREKPPFYHRGLDVATYFMAMEQLDGLSDVNADALKPYATGLPHPHIPLPDCIEEGGLWANMHLENMRRRAAKSKD